jgi:hypothetical protein
MGEPEDDGLELAWILWTSVAALFLIFGVAELVSFQHTVSFWLISGLVGTSCSIFALILSLRSRGAGNTLSPAMGGGEPESGDESTFVPSDETRGTIVDAALALAETQLLAQVAEDANLDGRTTGLLGFSGALAAVTIAAKEPIGGSLWLVPLFVLGAVTLVFLWILYGGTRFRDLLTALWHAPNRLGFGVPAWAFYEKFVGTSSLEARAKLLEELAGVIHENAARIGRKQRQLQVTTIAMIVGLIVAGLLIAFDRPTKMEPCSEKSPSCHHRVPQGSKKSVPAAPSPKTKRNGR